MRVKPTFLLSPYRTSLCERNRVRPESMRGGLSSKEEKASEVQSNTASTTRLLSKDVLFPTTRGSTKLRESGEEGPPTSQELAYFHKHVVQSVTADLKKLGFKGFDPLQTRVQSVMNTGNRNGTYWDVQTKLGNRPYYLVAISSDDIQGKVIRFEGQVNPRNPYSVTNNPLRLFETLSGLADPHYKSSYPVQNTEILEQSLKLSESSDGRRINPIYISKKTMQLFYQALTQAEPEYFAKRNQQLSFQNHENIAHAKAMPAVFGPIPIGSPDSKYQSIQTHPLGILKPSGFFNSSAIHHLQLIYDFSNPLEPTPVSLYRTSSKKEIY